LPGQKCVQLIGGEVWDDEKNFGEIGEGFHVVQFTGGQDGIFGDFKVLPFKNLNLAVEWLMIVKLAYQQVGQHAWSRVAFRNGKGGQRGDRDAGLFVCLLHNIGLYLEQRPE